LSRTVNSTDIYASRQKNGFADRLPFIFIPFLIQFRPNIGEAVVRVERMIVAVVVAVLAMFAVGSTAVAGADPDMTHNSVDMTHN
jgi:hypothetical protein